MLINNENVQYLITKKHINNMYIKMIENIRNIIYKSRF